VKELSESSEAIWRRKRIIERGIKVLRIGQSPFHLLLGVCWLFYYGKKGSILGLEKKVDLLN